VLQTGAARVFRAGSDCVDAPGRGSPGRAWVLTVDSLLDLLRVLWLLRHRAYPLREALQSAREAAAAGADPSSALQARLLAAAAAAGSAPPLRRARPRPSWRARARAGPGARYCSHCSKAHAPARLAKCAGCQLAEYCDRECHVARALGGPCCRHGREYACDVLSHSSQHIRLSCTPPVLCILS
jgi:hypothetical protein